MTALAAGTRLGPYQIISLLGSGGMGEVYRARDTRLERDVALKVLHARSAGDTERIERLIREAKVISTLSHPHIRAIYEATEYDGRHVIVMEYVDGDTLSQRLERRALPMPQALLYAEQLASALDAAHSGGIIHHDVKPANIVLTRHGVKLLDFGIAAIRGALATSRTQIDASTVTDSSSVPGTTAYMAPEQLDGSGDDPRSDIFAIGVVAYEMITGRKPFDGATRARVMAAILEHEPAPLSSADNTIPRQVEHVVMRCLAKDPGARWQTARDVASEFAWLQRTDATSLTDRQSGRPYTRRIIAVSAVAALAAIAIIGYLMTRTPDVTSLETPVRFLAAAPPNSVIAVTAGSFAISPDGRHLAFTAATGGGPRLLWIRSLDSFEARPLIGTDDARFPFWSPDSGTVAYFTANQLKTIDIDGSPLRIVADTEGSQWGTWGSNGDILFTRGGDELYRVRAAGGAPVLIWTPQEGDPRRVGGPEFLPDGQHFLIGVVEPETPQDQVSIYLGSLTNPLERLLVRADSQAVYAPPGYILYTLNGSLTAHPFDAGRRAIVGEPLPLPEPVAFVRAQRRSSVSASQTNVLAYRQGVPTTQLTWFDRSGRRIGTIGPADRWVNPAVSPDGARVAVTRLSPSITQSDIWVFEPRGQRPLTSSPGADDYAVWSPDGQRIAYSSSQGGFLDLYLKDAAAAAQDPAAVALKNNQHKLAMDWTRDGQTLVFLDSGGGALRRPLSLPLDGARAPAAELTLTDDSAASLPSEDQVQVSPDGRWMAYVSDVTGSAQVYVRQFPHGQRRWQLSTDGGFEPKWRGDGRELFYLAADQQLMSVAITLGDAGFEAQSPTPLFRATVLGAPFQNGFLRNEYAVTADGQRFLINEPIAGPAAYAIRVLLNWRALLPAH